MDFIIDTRIRQTIKHVEVIHHRQGHQSILLTFSPGESESLAGTLIAKAAEASVAQRQEWLSAQPAG